MVTSEEPGGFLPGHRSQLDFMAVVFLDERCDGVDGFVVTVGWVDANVLLVDNNFLHVLGCHVEGMLSDYEKLTSGKVDQVEAE